MLDRYLAPRTEAAYTLLRVAAGILLSFHGFQKLLGVLTDHQPPVFSQLWIGGVIEVVCGLAVAAGALTSWAAFLAAGTMFVAYVQFHWKFQGGAQLFPAVNKGEMALVYAAVFFFMACRGGGRFSGDALRASPAAAAAPAAAR